MKLNIGIKIIFLMLFLYLFFAAIYHFFIFGEIKNGYFYIDSGDYYQSIKRVGDDGEMNVVVPAKVVYYEYDEGYIFVIRKGIDVYEYSDYGDYVEEGILKYYLINVFSEDVFSTFSSKEMRVKLNNFGLADLGSYFEVTR